MTDASDLDQQFTRLVRLVEQRALPGVTRFSGPPPALQVEDVRFATLLDATTMALACPNDQKVLLLDISPKVYFETEQQIGKDTVLVRLDQIDDEELSLRLHDGWEFTAPHNLRKFVD